MDKQRLKQIRRAARRAEGAELHSLFMEVYGADFAGLVTEARARMSILEAVEELMHNPVGQEKIMEELLKQLIAEAKQTNVYLAQLVGAKPAAPAEPPKKGKAKQGETVTTLVPETKPDGTKTLVEKPKEEEEKPKITIEQLRELATRYSSAFGMEDLLSLNQKVGGAKKLSAIPESNYAVLYAEMQGRLDRENGSKATSAPELTLDDVKAKAKAFMDANGAPALTALLKAFGAEKLSALDHSKYPAFVEAISNV